MGMTTHIVGFRPPDEKWKQMKSVWDACKEAGVPVPTKVVDFFAGLVPDPTGVEVDICKDYAVSEYENGSRSGIEVDITKLPQDVKIIRFWNSW